MLDRFRRLVSSPAAEAPREDPHLSFIDHHEARRAQTAGAVLIDVREPDEWAAGHIADARLYPLPRIASDPDVGLTEDTAIVTYCKVGARAARAAEILAVAGYRDVRVMDGGYADWQAADYPVE